MLKPTQDRLLISAEAPDTISAGGIIIPGTVKEKINRGTVIAIGPKTKYSFELGDVVQYGDYAGIEVQDDDGKEYLIVKEADILFVLKN